MKAVHIRMQYKEKSRTVVSRISLAVNEERKILTQ